MLEDYDFETNGELKKHLKENHFNDKAIGSVFYRNVFEGPQELIDFALKKIKDYSGERMERELEMPSYVGLDAVVSIEELPEGTKLKKEMRDGMLVNIACGVKRKPTNKIVIIAGPLEEKPNKHGFYTIYPGKYCPDLNDKDFWRKHAFAVDK